MAGPPEKSPDILSKLTSRFTGSTMAYAICRSGNLHMSRVPIDAQEVIARVVREGVDAILERGEAAALVATVIERPHAADRVARNRVAMRMERDETSADEYVRGKISRRTDGRYLAGDVLRWGRDIYGPKAFADLPPTSRTVTDLIEVHATASSAADMLVLPGTLERCHERIKELERENAELRKAAESEVNRRLQLGSRFRKKH